MATASSPRKMLLDFESLCPVMRPVVIDACNVARSHGKNRQNVNVHGILVCLKFFLERGHRTVTFIPVSYKSNPNVDNPDILVELERLELLAFTSCRRFKEGPRPERSEASAELWGVSNYDDLYMIEYAHRKGGVVISNDNFTDVAQTHPEWRTVIQQRTLKIHWNCQRQPIFTRSRDGFGISDTCIDDMLLCHPDSTDYGEVSRAQLNQPEEKQGLLHAVQRLIHMELPGARQNQVPVPFGRLVRPRLPGSDGSSAGWTRKENPRDFLQLSSEDLTFPAPTLPKNSDSDLDPMKDFVSPAPVANGSPPSNPEVPPVKKPLRRRMTVADRLRSQEEAASLRSPDYFRPPVDEELSESEIEILTVLSELFDPTSIREMLKKYPYIRTPNAIAELLADNGK